MREYLRCKWDSLIQALKEGCREGRGRGMRLWGGRKEWHDRGGRALADRGWAKVDGRMG